MIGRMHPAAVVLIIALAVLALDRLGLWAESRGWIYWRRRRPEASGAVLNPLMDVFQPGHVHVVEAQQDRDVLVRTDAAGAGVAHDIAMHTAAYSPLYLSREDVPAETIAKERSIAEETTRAEGKPEKAIPRIVEGRLNGFFKENCLVDQPYAKDPKTTVGKVIKAAGGTITGFLRFRVGA